MRIKVLAVICALFLAAAGLMGVLTYSSAQVESQATITITDPENALVATLGFHEQGGKIEFEDTIPVEQGNTKTSSFMIENNMAQDLNIALDWRAFTRGPEIEFDYPQTIGSGQRENVDIIVSAEPTAQLGKKLIPVDINTQWSGGNAKLEVIIPIKVERAPEPELEDSTGFTTREANDKTSTTEASSITDKTPEATTDHEHKEKQPEAEESTANNKETTAQEETITEKNTNQDQKTTPADCEKPKTDRNGEQKADNDSTTPTNCDNDEQSTTGQNTTAANEGTDTNTSPSEATSTPADSPEEEN